jgi:ABC-type transport system substrate-binding protein
LNILWHAAGGTDGKFECTYLDYQSTVPDLLYDTLLKLDMEDTSKYVPRMADKWTVSDDGLVYSFHIRDGLNWSDGVPVTADDFVFSLRPSSAATAYRMSVDFCLHQGCFRLRREEGRERLGY